MHLAVMAENPIKGLQGEVDTTGYPTSDITDSESSIKMFISALGAGYSAPRGFSALGQFTSQDLLGITESTVIARGDYIVRNDDTELDVSEVLPESSLTRNQYRLVKLRRRDLD